jgi:peptidoglycan/xylan/chitin deacetylase (PgdA/CDA1 family)
MASPAAEPRLSVAAGDASASPTVCLSFDFDALSLWIRPDGSQTPGNLSRGEFGRVGAERLLALLARHQVPATWFIPGHTVDTFPETVRAIAAAGHEIGHHNYCHENPRTLDREGERAVIAKGIEAIERVIGSRPIGYRSPSWDVSENTLELLIEAGFEYDSSLMAHDFVPYRPRRGDVIRADTGVQFGTPLPLMEMPVDWSLDDFPYFGLRWSTGLVGLRTPSHVEEAWRDEFEWMCENVPGGVFILTMHPQVIGRGARLAMLDRLISSMKAQSGVRFRRMGEVARHWATLNPLEA